MTIEKLFDWASDHYFDALMFIGAAGFAFGFGKDLYGRVKEWYLSHRRVSSKNLETKQSGASSKNPLRRKSRSNGIRSGSVGKHTRRSTEI